MEDWDEDAISVVASDAASDGSPASDASDGCTGRTIDRLCVENRALQSELEQLRQALQSSPAPGRQCNASTGLDHFVLGSMRSAEGEWKANTKSVPTPTKPCPVAASAVNGTETPSLSALSGKSTSHLGVLAPGDTSTPHGFSASALVSSSSSSRISRGALLPQSIAAGLEPEIPPDMLQENVKSPCESVATSHGVAWEEESGRSQLATAAAVREFQAAEKARAALQVDLQSCMDENSSLRAELNLCTAQLQEQHVASTAARERHESVTAKLLSAQQAHSDTQRELAVQRERLCSLSNQLQQSEKRVVQLEQDVTESAETLRLTKASGRTAHDAANDALCQSESFVAEMALLIRDAESTRRQSIEYRADTARRAELIRAAEYAGKLHKVEQAHDAALQASAAKQKSEHDVIMARREKEHSTELTNLRAEHATVLQTRLSELNIAMKAQLEAHDEALHRQRRSHQRALATVADELANTRAERDRLNVEIDDAKKKAEALSDAHRTSSANEVLIEELRAERDALKIEVSEERERSQTALRAHERAIAEASSATAALVKKIEQQDLTVNAERAKSSGTHREQCLQLEQLEQQNHSQSLKLHNLRARLCIRAVLHHWVRKPLGAAFACWDRAVRKYEQYDHLSAMLQASQWRARIFITLYQRQHERKHMAFVLWEREIRRRAEHQRGQGVAVVHAEQVGALERTQAQFAAEAKKRHQECQELKASLVKQNDETFALKNTVVDLEGQLRQREARLAELAPDRLEAQWAQRVETIRKNHIKVVEEHQMMYQGERKRRIAIQEDILSLRGHVRVFCRIRPRRQQEVEAGAFERVFASMNDATVLIDIPRPDESQPNPMDMTQAAGSTIPQLYQGGEWRHKFDAVFGPDAGQEDMYAEVAFLLNGVVDNGISVTIFAYGATGSGKSFTMGTCSISTTATAISENDPCSNTVGPDAGIIPRALTQVCGKIQDQSTQVELSVLEVYNDEVYDLARSGTGAGMYVGWTSKAGASKAGAAENGAMDSMTMTLADVRLAAEAGSDLDANAGARAGIGSGAHTEDSEDIRTHRQFNNPKREVRGSTGDVIGQTWVRVHDAEHALTVFHTAEQMRCTASHRMNEHSSRSHLIVFLRLKEQNEFALQSSARQKRHGGCMTLVDLAGSENIQRSGVAGVMLEEAKHIHRSLSALGTVVAALSHAEPDVRSADGAHSGNFVPFRDSTLTLVLRQSLMHKKAKIVVISTISPVEVCFQHLKRRTVPVLTLLILNHSAALFHFCCTNEFHGGQSALSDSCHTLDFAHRCSRVRIKQAQCRSTLEKPKPRARAAAVNAAPSAAPQQSKRASSTLSRLTAPTAASTARSKRASRSPTKKGNAEPTVTPVKVRTSKVVLM